MVCLNVVVLNFLLIKRAGEELLFLNIIELIVEAFWL